MYRLNKLVRGCLFTPADRLSALHKAWAISELDVMVIDLEDAVAGCAAAKALGRKNLGSFLSSRDGGSAAADASGASANVSGPASKPNVVVRINCPDTSPYGDADIAALQGLHGLGLGLAGVGVDAVLLPKAQSVQRVRETALKLPGVPLWCMIETPRGVQRADELAALPEVDCLVFGSNDLTKELGAVLTPLQRLPLQYAMGRTVMAARAEGKLVVDGV